MATIFSNIKERVLYISENKGITREKFFEDLGITYGNFKGKAKEKALSSDVLAKIIAKYSDVSPEWLLTGRGEMLKEEEEKNIVSQALPAANDELVELLREKAAILEGQIKDKEEKEAMYKEKIMALENELRVYKSLSQPSRAVASGNTQYSTARV
jgi:hypothetical protein